MNLEFLFTTDFQNWVLIPLMIFCARIVDVSIGTIRLIFIAKGYRKVAPILGFFEVLIWILVIRQIFSHMSNFLSFIAYAAGFASGTYIGMYIEEKFTNGKVLIRIITRREADELVQALIYNKFKITSVDAQGNSGQVKIVFLVTKKKNISDVISLIKALNPKAFYTVEDLRFAIDHEAHMVDKPKSRIHLFGFLRKGK